jgi:hypothetical protein
MFLHITEAQYLTDYKVQVVFNNGKQGVADLTELLQGDVFAPLRDETFFAQFWVDAELATLVWPNGADVAPEFVYYQAFKDDPQLAQKFTAWGYLN